MGKALTLSHAITDKPTQQAVRQLEQLVESLSNQLDGFVGLPAKLKVGAFTDRDFTNPADGMLGVDTANNRLYVRVNGAWISVVLA